MSVRLAFDWRQADYVDSAREFGVEACRSVGLSAADVALKPAAKIFHQTGQTGGYEGKRPAVCTSWWRRSKYPLITDGVVQVESIDKTEEWLGGWLAKMVILIFLISSLEKSEFGMLSGLLGHRCFLGFLRCYCKMNVFRKLNKIWWCNEVLSKVSLKD